MAPMINPFDAGGYTLAEMTQAINILPNVYTRLGTMGLFTSLLFLFVRGLPAISIAEMRELVAHTSKDDHQ